ncbi:MAG: metallopeptidase family protein [Polyangia bacterium]
MLDLGPLRPRLTRLLLIGVCLGGGLQCRRAEPQAEAQRPARAGAAAGAAPVSERASLQTVRPGHSEPARPPEAGAVPRALQRCFPEDTALSPPRSLSALLGRSADRYELAAQPAVHHAPGSRDTAAPGPSDPRGATDPQGTTAAKDTKDTKDTKDAKDAKDPKAATDALYRESLACADEALRIDPRAVEALHNRGLALQALGQLEAARDAFTRALAIDPDDAETLAGAADLYVNHLPASAEYSAIGVEYARRGEQRLRAVRNREGRKPLLGRLMLLEGQGLIDLGRAREALGRLDASIATSDTVQARYERALALFDLCRFADAKRGFQDVLERDADDAWAHYHLGLVLEQLGQPAAAETELGTARRLAPQDFTAPLSVSPAEFKAIVDKEVLALPPELRADLRHVALETAELPDLSDLRAEEPPLSPTILGLFRGLPLPTPQSLPTPAERMSAGAAPALPPAQALGESEQRTIVLYRKNLLRAVKTRDELVQQVRMTLLHELGHLRGEDDDELRARGLE